MELQDSQAQYRNTNVELEDEKRENVTLKVTAEKTTASYAEIDATLRDLKMKLKVKAVKAFSNKKRPPFY
jgi:tRNA threonylcarbamoyladenosine modification (KEOPS) complex  Pcc1 subunit